MEAPTVNRVIVDLVQFSVGRCLFSVFGNRGNAVPLSFLRAVLFLHNLTEP